MKPRANIWRRKAVLLVVTGLFLVANAAFLIGSRSIREARRAALEQRRASLTSDVTAREAEATRLEGQRERIAQVSGVIEEFYGRRVGSRRETLAPIVEEIHAVMRRAGVSVKTIGYSTTRVEKLPLWEMQITFGFASDYARFKRLLALFEANRLWIVVREVSLARGSEVPGEVQVRLALATYFSGDDRPSVPAAAPVEPARATRQTRETVRRTVER